MNYENILVVLNEIKNGNIPLREHGICANLERIMFYKFGTTKESENFIQHATTYMFGRFTSSPVEGDIISYLNNQHKWDKETEFGLRRYGFLDKLISYAEDKLKEEV